MVSWLRGRRRARRLSATRDKCIRLTNVSKLEACFLDCAANQGHGLRMWKPSALENVHGAANIRTEPHSPASECLVEMQYVDDLAVWQLNDHRRVRISRRR